jgi:hypothetical protein
MKVQDKIIEKLDNDDFDGLVRILSHLKGSYAALYLLRALLKSEHTVPGVLAQLESRLP